MNAASCVVGEICGTNTKVPLKCPPGSYTALTTGPMLDSSSSNCAACELEKVCNDWGLS